MPLCMGKGLPNPDAHDAVQYELAVIHAVEGQIILFELPGDGGEGEDVLHDPALDLLRYTVRFEKFSTQRIRLSILFKTLSKESLSSL